MEKAIRTVALAGPNGNLGVPVLKHLISNGFNVTVLVRKEGEFPPGVKVQVVDFGSIDALQSALEGQDAFVDATNTMDDTPIRLMNAAAAAGVRRYIPSDFSLDPYNAKLNMLPVFYQKAKRDQHLFDTCTKSGMTWSIVCNGPFLDWNLRSGFMNIDLFKKQAHLLDGGENAHVWTTLDQVGKAVAGILLHPAETKNRPVFVHSVVKSEREIVELAKDALGSDGWFVSRLDAEAVYQKAMADFGAGIYSLDVFGSMIRYANVQPEMAHPWSKPDNQLLGLGEMSDSQLKSLICEVVEKGPMMLG